MAQIYISLGSNVDREHYVNAGLNALSVAYGRLTLSSLFESEAVGFSGAAFYNLVIGIITFDSIEQVAEELKTIEVSHGRAADAKKYSPRTLDLDLLLYDDLIINTPAQLPRDEITKNAFVLRPLAEVAPLLIHPILNINYQTLWQEYNKSSQKLRKVPLNWQP
jgi:2-amino-4-hydroxy-6-hydroxymethyldihydropteridine diphosphokinase